MLKFISILNLNYLKYFISIKIFHTLNKQKYETNENNPPELTFVLERFTQVRYLEFWPSAMSDTSVS